MYNHQKFSGIGVVSVRSTNSTRLSDRAAANLRPTVSEFRWDARQWLTFAAMSVACEFANKFCGHRYRFPLEN